MKRLNKIGLFLIFSVSIILGQVKAAEDHYANKLIGANITSNATLSVEVDYFNSITPFNFKDVKYKNIISFKYTGQLHQYYQNNFFPSVNFNVEVFDINGNVIYQATNKTLSLILNSSSGVEMKDIDFLEISPGGAKIKVIINSVSGALPNDIELVSEIYCERYYQLDEQVAPIISHILNTTDNTATLYWNYVVGAEYYELEWCFISTYAANYSLYNTPSDIPTNQFTRITTKNNSYTINLPFDDGKVFYRIRAVGRIENYWNYEKRTIWSDNNANQFQVYNNNDDKNWTYQATYAEDGKRKEVVSYFDGSGRNRQTATINNTDNVTIYAETYYDYEGRQSLQILPTPALNSMGVYENRLDYKGGITLLNGQPLSAKDIDNKATCSTNNFSLSNTQGASYYYSENNYLSGDGYHSYIPDADGYVYSQTVYGKDGKPIMNISPGEAFKQGEGHEIKYGIGTPIQQQLDRLFGNDAGKAKYYTLEAVKDPNGQYSLSYKNLAGQVVATSLCGEAPQNMDAIASNTGSGNIIYGDLNNLNNWDETQEAYIINSNIFVPGNAIYTFNYTLSPETYQGLCNSPAYDCSYELSIDIYDECGTLVTTIQNMILNPTNGLTANFTVTFPDAGFYNIVKKLTLDQAALQNALDDFTANYIDNCITDYTNILLNNTNIADACADCQSTNCIPDLSDIAGSCDDILEILKSDMSPGGRYFDNLPGSNTTSTNINGWLFANISNLYSGANIWSDMGFTNSSGTVLTSWDLIRNNWQNGWETQQFSNALTINGQTYNSLVEFHPEYCHYQTCTLINANTCNGLTNMEFDTYIRTLSYNDAANEFGFTQGNCNLTCNDLLNVLDKDPFFSSNAQYSCQGVGSTYYNNMSSDITSSTFQSTSGSLLCMWDAAVEYAGQGATCDEIWTIFTGLYLSKKAYYFKAYINGQGCNYLPDNTPPDGICDDSGGSADGFYINFIDPTIFDYISSASDAQEFGDQIFNPCTGNYINNPMLEPWASVGCPSCPLSEIDGWSNADGTSWAENGVLDNTQGISVNTLLYPLEAGKSYTFCYDVQTFCDRTIYVVLSDDSGWDAINNTPSSSNYQIIIQQNVNLGCSINNICTTFTVQDNYQYLYIIDEKILDINGQDNCYAACGTNKDVEIFYSNFSLTKNCDTIPLEFNCLCSELKTAHEAYVYTWELDNNGQNYNPAVSDPDFFQTMADYYNQEHQLTVTTQEIQTWYNNCSSSNWSNPVSNPSTDPAVPEEISSGCLQEDPCGEEANNLINFYANYYYELQYEQLVDQFINEYREKCLHGDNFAEDFSMQYPDKEYHFTLYYYDRAGNLIQTVPPEGVRFLSDAEIAMAQNHRDHPDIYPYVTASHSLPTKYYYNSFNQLTAQSVPDHDKILLAQSNQVNTNYNFTELAFAGNTAFTAANNQLYYQINNSFVAVNSFPLLNGNITGLEKLQNNGLIIVTDMGEVIYTSDASDPQNISWQTQTFNNYTFNDVATYGSAVYIIGGDNNNAPISYFSSDIINQSLTLSSYTGVTPLISCDIYPSVSGYVKIACNDQKIYFNGNQPIITANSGSNWTTVNLLSETEAVVSVSGGGTPTIYRINDLGTSFTQIQATINGTYNATKITDIEFVDALNGMAVGDYLLQLTTTDGGYSWNVVNTSPLNFTVNALAVNNYYNIGMVTGSQLYNNVIYNNVSQLFYYNQIGQLKASTNSKQFPNNEYSYSKYDPLGRIIESGQTVAASEPLLADLNQNSFPDGWDNSNSRTEVTYTQYDAPLNNAVNNYFGASGQTNLRNRVASVYYKEKATDNNYLSASHYSYDIHGNVKTLITEYTPLSFYGAQLKRTDYEYDLISGNVKKVSYEGGKWDKFYHKYYYDADNRIIEAYTSDNGFWYDLDAAYFYYLHGPLARIEIGDHKVQGLDYAYTLQGWLKGVNSNQIAAANDQGLDGVTGGNYLPNLQSHEYIARDAMGFSLHYFNTTNYSDYNAVGQNNVNANRFLTDVYQAPVQANNLYNGNISGMAVALTDENYTPLPLMWNTYRYDQLNRITAYTPYSSTNDYTNSASNNEFKTSYTYDANGNIQSLIRYNDQGVVMDELTYYYDKISQSTGDILRSNRLYHVYDNAGTVNNNDYPQTSAYTNIANGDFAYDALGNLIRDNANAITQIDWNLQGKVQKIYKLYNANAQGDNSNIEYQYNPFGNRITKTVKPIDVNNLESDQTNWDIKYYSLDAQGNVMSIYNHDFQQAGSNTFVSYLTQTKIPIYGSDRLGIQQFSRQNKRELIKIFNGYINAQGEIVPTNGPIAFNDNSYSSARISSDSVYTLNTLGQTIAFTFGLQDTLILVAEGSLKDATGNFSVNNNTYTIYPSDEFTFNLNGSFTITNGYTDTIDFVADTNNFQLSGFNSITLVTLQGGLSKNTTKSFMHYTGNKRYELKNHLGNVLSVVTDKKIAHTNQDLYWNFDNLAFINGSYVFPDINSNSVLGAAYGINTVQSNNGSTAIETGTNKYIQYPDVASLDFGTQDFTVSIWVNKLYPQNNWGNAVVSKWNTGASPGTNEWLLTVGRGQNGNSPQSASFVIESGTTRYEVIGTSTITYGTWNMITVTRTGGYLKLYVNGVLENQSYIGNVPVNNINGREMQIGRIDNGVFSNLYVDDLHVINRALSSSEINNLYNNNAPIYAGVYYTPDIMVYNDYYPFGMLMPSRHGNSESYEYSFQAQEHDDEIKGPGNSINYKYRMNDTRLGCFFAIDPLAAKYPWNSTYAFSENRVIDGVELEGLETVKHPLGKQGYDWIFTQAHTAKSLKDKENGWKGFKCPDNTCNVLGKTTNIYYLQKPILVTYTDFELVEKTKEVTKHTFASYDIRDMEFDPQAPFNRIKKIIKDKQINKIQMTLAVDEDDKEFYKEEFIKNMSEVGVDVTKYELEIITTGKNEDADVGENFTYDVKIFYTQEVKYLEKQPVEKKKLTYGKDENGEWIDPQ